MDKRISVCFVSTSSCEATGGQTAYFRALGDELSGRMPVSGVARFHTLLPKSDYASFEEPREIPREGWATRIIAPSGPARATLPRTLSMITRQMLRGAGIELFRNAFSEGMSKAIPADANVVHYVGAGWDLIGHVALAEARRRGVAFVVTPFVHPGQWADSDLDMAFYNQADAVFVCSEYERDYLRKKGVTSPNLALTGLAPVSSLEGERQRFRDRYGLGDRPLMLFIARKQKYKGYHAICRAMATILEAIPDACFVSVGPNSEPPYPEIKAGAHLDLGELKTDATDQQLKADALAACDLYCMPSEAEAFGIAYVEAWAFGMPVIAGGAPAVAELVENGVTGYRVKDQNEAEIAEYAIRLLGDATLRERMGRTGQQIQRERYTWDAISHYHEGVYREALAGVTGK